MVNPRVAKLQDQIQKLVAETLERRVKDPRLGFITVTDVHLTGDTQESTVFYTVLGSADELSATAAALESAKGMIRSVVGKQLGLRHAPSITFVPDSTPETAKNIEDLLARARSGDDAVQAAAAGATYAGDADPYRHDDEDDVAETGDVVRGPVGPGPQRAEDDR